MCVMVYIGQSWRETRNQQDGCFVYSVHECRAIDAEVERNRSLEEIVDRIREKRVVSAGKEKCRFSIVGRATIHDSIVTTEYCNLTN